MQITIRDLHESDPDDYIAGTCDLVVTDAKGVVHYSPDLYDSKEEALEALEEMKKAPEEMFEDWDEL